MSFKIENTYEDTHGRDAVQMQSLRQNVYDTLSVGGSRTYAYGREASRLSCLREDLYTVECFKYAHETAYRSSGGL